MIRSVLSLKIFIGAYNFGNKKVAGGAGKKALVLFPGLLNTAIRYNRSLATILYR